MQPQQNPRIDLGDLKGQIVKKLGSERSNRYFHYLNRFFSQKLSKSEFDKLCHRVLGRENLPLHNQLIKSILKNACQAKVAQPVQGSGPTRPWVHVVNSSLSGEAGHEQTGAIIQSHNQTTSIWSNGVLPISPRKIRSGIRDRNARDRPSPFGLNGKVGNATHQSTEIGQNSGRKADMENGTLTPCDYQRPIEHLHSVSELPEIEKETAAEGPAQKTRMYGKGPADALVVEDGEEVEQSYLLNFSKSPLIPPLGMPYCSASVGGSRKLFPVGTSDCVSFYDSGCLPDTDTLRRRMEQIAAAQGLRGVSVECSNTLNIMLDLYLKRLIRSSVDIVGVRSGNESIKYPAHKQQIQGKFINGMWLSNNLQLQGSSGFVGVTSGQRQQGSVSLLDFKVAMELNPRQLGEDWPLLMEKICMHAFDG